MLVLCRRERCFLATKSGFLGGPPSTSLELNLICIVTIELLLLDHTDPFPSQNDRYYVKSKALMSGYQQYQAAYCRDID